MTRLTLLGALMLLVLAAGPTLALTPEEEQELAQRISAGARPHIIQLGETRIEDYKRPPDADWADDKVHEFLVIRSPWDEPVKLAAFNFAMRTLQVGGGPGPNAIYVASSGVGRCCFTIHLIWIEHRMHHQAIAIDSDLKIEARNGPPRLRFRDDALLGSDAPQPAAQHPEVVLAYDPRIGEYALDPDAMRKPPPSDAALAEQAADIRSKFDMLAIEEIRPVLSLGMLDLIYGGNAASARALLDAAWPEAKPGKEEFLSDFTHRLWAGETWRRFELGRLLEADRDFPRPAAVQ
jgi:hypothetical protein